MPGRPANWTGQAYLSTGPVDLPKLSQYVKMPFATYGGRFDNRIWIDFASGKLQTAGGDLTGSDIALRVRPTQPRLDVPIANFNWDLAQQDDEYTLQSREPARGTRPAAARRRHAGVAPARLAYADRPITARQSLQRGQMFGVAGDVVDLGILGEFARALPLPSKAQNDLIRFNPRGQIANYTLQTERPRPTTDAQMLAQRQTGAEPPMRYTVKGDLHGVSVQAQEPPPGLTINNHPRAGIPGVENLWGSIDADQDHGSAVIDTKNTAITLPGVFDNPRLVLDQIDGRVTWTLADAPGKPHKAITAHVETLHVKNADAEASATADYQNEGEGRGSLDLKANAAHLNVTSLVHYLPTSISEKVRLYLGHALQAGVSRNATIEIHGDLTKFPYSRFPDAGQFRIVAPFSGGKFEPTPYPPRTMANGTPNVWPAFDGIDGTFHLAENKLGFDISRGHYLGVSVVKTTGRIEDLGNRESKLLIDADAHGPITDMLHYVEDSSLGALSHHVSTKIHATGNAALALQLEIPRVAPPPGVRPHVGYKGALTFNGNELAYGAVPPLSNLKGRARLRRENRIARWPHGEVSRRRRARHRRRETRRQLRLRCKRPHWRRRCPRPERARSGAGRADSQAHQRHRAVRRACARREKRVAASRGQLRLDRPRPGFPGAVQQERGHAHARLVHLHAGRRIASGTRRETHARAGATRITCSSRPARKRRSWNEVLSA